MADTGIAPQYQTILDQEHHQIFGIVDAMERALRAEDRAGILRALYTLANESREHFEREEFLFAAAAPEELNRHKEAHEQILSWIERLLHDIATKRGKATLWRCDVLRYWFNDHMTHFDRPMFQEYFPDDLPAGGGSEARFVELRVAS